MSSVVPPLNPPAETAAPAAPAIAVSASAAELVLPPWRRLGFVRGLLLAAAVAVLAMALSRVPVLQGAGLSALTLAIVLGIALGNTLFPRVAPYTASGVDFARSTLLRLGIVLYGLRVTFQDIASVGWPGIAMAVVVVAVVFTLGTWLGTRVFRLDRETSMLIGAGSAICGAAAVLATEPVVRAQAHKVSVAVATVVVFGTVAMFAYPWLYPVLGLDAHHYGLYVGGTVHEVAQVVVAGRAISEQAAAVAVIEKMLRVMLLAPFLMLLSLRLQAGEAAGGSRWRFAPPWFAVAFIAVAALNSLQVLPPVLVAALVELDTALLAMAMAALGLRTHLGAVRQAGPRPLLLAAVLFAVLLLGGRALVQVVVWAG